MKRRKGFTLIELLVVLGITMALTGLLVAGYLHLHRVAARTTTIAQLHVCQSLLQEYENRAGLAGIEAYSTSNPLQQTDPNAPAGTQQLFPVFVDPDPVLNASYTYQSHNHASVNGSFWPCYFTADLLTSQGGSTGLGGSTLWTFGSARYQCPAVLCTRDVMYVLLRVPANRTTVQSLPPKQILEAPSGSPPVTIDQGPVLLDGWGNPIIFVPRGGMHFNRMDYSTNPPQSTPLLVRSSGIVPPRDGGFSDDPPLTGNEVPFWASAGEDGDFLSGNDNIYSFEN